MSNPTNAAERLDARMFRCDNVDRVVLIGARRDARQYIRSLKGEARELPQIIGFVEAGHSVSERRRQQNRHVALHPQADPIPVLGRIDHLQSVLDRSGATVILVTVSSHRAHSHLGPHLASLNRPGVAVRWVMVDDNQQADRASSGGSDHGTKESLATSRSDELETVVPPPYVPLHSSSSFPRWLTRPVNRAYWSRCAKRLSDIVVGTLALIVLSPLFLVVGLLVWISSGWPIFYTQERVGQGGRLFRMIKFRSMGKDAEKSTGPIWATDQDTRCTRVGAWLRKTSVDEFPQLINVLKGEMTLVGPRPERPVFVEQFRESMPDYDLRHAVPGGMTGWAQVHGWRGRTSLRKRVQYDLDYIQRWSFGLDFRILLMTIQHVACNKTNWKGSGRKNRGGSSRVA